MKFWKIICLQLILLIPGCSKNENSDRTYLFNGKDLESWDTYLGIPHSVQDVPYLDKDENGRYTEAFGLNNDPMQIFSIVEEDGTKVIRISGYVWGGLMTKEAYENYHLHLEFKWGEQKHPPRENLPRNSGLCYHSVGDYGLFWTYWMRSCELEIKEGGLGDFVRVDDVYASVRAEFDPELTPVLYKYSPEGEPRGIHSGAYMVCASDDYDLPFGQWNSVDLYTYDQEAIHVINNQMVLYAEEIREKIKESYRPLTRGKILLQSEGAEIFYRNIYIEPISELPYTH